MSSSTTGGGLSSSVDREVAAVVTRLRLPNTQQGSQRTPTFVRNAIGRPLDAAKVLREHRLEIGHVTAAESCVPVVRLHVLVPVGSHDVLTGRLGTW
jgi:hypothetical protein